MNQYEAEAPPTTRPEAWARVAGRWGFTPWQITKIQTYQDNTLAARDIRGEVSQLCETYGIKQ